MAEFIAAIIEAFVGLIVAFVEALPAIVEGLVFLAVGSITILAYAISPKFRERKRAEWKTRPRRKYLDLGISSVCLGLILGLAVWVSFAMVKPTKPTNTFTAEQPGIGEDLRFVVRTESKGGATNQLGIVIKGSGVSNLLHSKSLGELRQAVRENVTVNHLKAGQSNTFQSAEGGRQAISLRLQSNN